MDGIERREAAISTRDRGGVGPASPGRRRRRWLPWLLLVCLLVAGGTWWTRREHGALQVAPTGASVVPVTVAAAAHQDVPITVDALGTLQAMNTITVKGRVDGTLTEVSFEEGQDVKRGDILARIDDRSYRAALDNALAKQAYDEAQLANARLDLNRYISLLRSQGVTQQQVDTQRAQVAMYEAQVRQDQASVATARVDLDHTVIRAPIDGRVGIRQVDAGNLVRSSDSIGIVTISQVRPIAALFALPQQDLPQLQAALAAGPVPIETVPAQHREPAFQGKVLTMDNSVQSTTGTIKVKAIFPNEDSRLWPGAFVNLRIQLEVRQGVLVVPLVAIQRGPDGSFVFVVRPDGTLEKRPVAIATQTTDLALIQKGLEPAEKVVTSGTLRLTAGARVTVTGQ